MEQNMKKRLRIYQWLIAAKKQPITAGVMLGLLSYKPQLTLLLSVALSAAKM